MNVITLAFEKEEVELLLAALAKAPLEISIGLWTKIQQQAAPQVKAAETAEVKE